MPERHSISVIIPAYNRAELIGETLRSLLNQTLPAKEIIVVDDGSTDGTAERVDEEFAVFSSQFSGNPKLNIPTLKILRQKNAGPGAARNRGFAESTGQFIHFFDSDDIAGPNKHEVQLKALLKTGADIAYGPWVKGRFLPLEKLKHGNCAVESSKSKITRYPLSVTRNSVFQPEGPVLQARGLPDGDLLQALLTNWSVVPHACLFRRSILEWSGGFPEDIWVGEDQVLFLRCLLAGAKVVHTPGTMVFYRLGDAGKLTESLEGQRMRVVDWGRFLLKASEEVASESRRVPAEAQGRGEGKSAKNLTTIEHWGRGEMEQPKVGPKGEGVGTTESKDTENTENQFVQKQGSAWASQAGAAFSNPCTSELAQDAENTTPNRSAISPASSLDARNLLLANAMPSAWFGFRLRAYVAWRDLRAFFPGEYLDLECGLERIWNRSRFSGLWFRVSSFILGKWGGLKDRIYGHRWPSSFRCELASKTSLEALAERDPR